jgi:hypothetical protein
MDKRAIRQEIIAKRHISAKKRAQPCAYLRFIDILIR